ncbi:MAG: hypothetical protein HC769_02920 [Cyanobacteria bacterium CRU_2_1]|nr:hypothetical protein [Cyanobacteria bacterium RU_5_0]NJR57888.1 hypothetical protein [Cyanobacteria bacterium CRU_2_1]
MNTQLVDSIVQTILALSPQERVLLEEKLFANLPYPSDSELLHLAEQGNAFEFLHDEPDLYSLEDGEAIEWT